MKKLLKPYSFLFYFLVILVFFFLGMLFAALTGAAKNQGLAGGAIIFGYGVITAFFALLVALFAVYKLSASSVIKLNKFFGIIFLGLIAYFTWNYFTNIKPKREKQQQEIPQKPRPTSPTADMPLGSNPMTMLYKNTLKKDSKVMGLGIFKPTLFKNKTLFFYNNLNLEKSIVEHTPIDSITFKQSEYGGFEIETAPPFLVPEHLKLDYDLFYFKAVSVSEDFIEVIVNSTTQKTSFVKKDSGELMYWPEFLLSVHSVEFINPKNQFVYIKPLKHASRIKENYSFFKPIKVKQNWMYVLLINDEHKTINKGWIKWKEGNELLINYNLLS